MLGLSSHFGESRAHVECVHNEGSLINAFGNTGFLFSVISKLLNESFTPNDAHGDVKRWPLGFFVLFPIKKAIFLWGGKGDSQSSLVHCPLVWSTVPGALPGQAWLGMYAAKVCEG